MSYLFGGKHSSLVAHWLSVPLDHSSNLSLPSNYFMIMQFIKGRYYTSSGGHPLTGNGGGGVQNFHV